MDKMDCDMESMSSLHFSRLHLDSGDNNELENNLNEISMENPQLPSTIEHKIISSDKYTTYSKINTYLSNLNENKIPYPNQADIPKIKIKNENYFKYGKKIELYENFDDTKFNKCKICKKFDNKFFCIYCKKNICGNCKMDNEHKQHIFIDLEADYVQSEVKNYKSKILELFFQDFNELKKEEKNDSDGIIKKEVKFELDENEMNNYIEEALKEDTNDISLIKIILKKDYKNYFHYQNIKECYEYVNKKYNINNDKKMNLK